MQINWLIAHREHHNIIYTKITWGRPEHTAITNDCAVYLYDVSGCRLGEAGLRQY